MITTPNRFSLPIVAALLLFLLSASGPPTQAYSPSLPTDLPQWTTEQHIMGFLPDRVYLVGLPHTLSVTFEGTTGVKPIIEKIRTTDVHNSSEQPFSKVTYPDLWGGISLIYETTPTGIAKSTYIVEPYGNIEQIRLRYNLPVDLMPDGSLQFTPGGEGEGGYFRESAPIAWQEIEGRQIPVEVSFHLLEDAETENQKLVLSSAQRAQAGETKIQKRVVGFQLGSYNRAYPVIIDPTYHWHTFMGSTAFDVGADIVIDGNGNIYVTGYSEASWNGPGGQLPLNAHTNNRDIVVMKLDSNGAYQWHTFMGSSALDQGHSLVLGSSDNIYITGQSDSTWNGPGGQAPLNAYIGSQDIVVIKLNSSGAYQWHTFIGSSSIDSGLDLNLDVSGNLYIIGSGGGTWNGPGGQAPLNAYTGSQDIVVLKLDSNGAYQWHTFMGSSSDDFSFYLTLDGSGNIYISGHSFAAWNGPGGQMPLNAHTGGRDIVVIKLNSSGAYQWHTFMGSSGPIDSGRGIAVSGSGDIYVMAFSNATWNGPGGQAPLNAYSGSQDIVLLKLDNNGAYQWHTFMGGSGFDSDPTLIMDGVDNIYITAFSDATWNGPGGQAPLNAYSSGEDIVVLKLNSSGAYQWHTFMGSSANDRGNGLALDNSGNVYVVGHSYAAWNGPGGQAPLNGYTSNSDIVVFKLAQMDFGDAPDTSMGTGSGNYQTSISDNGPRHVLSGPYLGTCVDAESDAFPSVTANGDDNTANTPVIGTCGTGNDDEDGITFTTPITQGNPNAEVRVTASASCTLNAWIDYNTDGDFVDAGEQIFIDQALSMGPNNLIFSVPGAATIGTTSSRFRCSTQIGLPPTGAATDGEVEDHLVAIVGIPEIAVLDGATNIPDGVGSVSFGSTLVGVPLTKTFTISNSGNVDLSLTPPLSLPSGFSLINGFGSTAVAPNNTTTFEVQCDALTVGAFSGTLSFVNNDTDETPFDFTIGCEATAPAISVSKQDSLQVDINNNGLVDPGDTLRYTVTIINNGTLTATGVTFSDTPDGNTRLLTGTVTTSAGTVTSGNTAGDSTVGVDVGGLSNGGGSVTLTFEVEINNPLPTGVTQVSNQSIVSGSNFASINSDDPATSVPGDATITPVNISAVPDRNEISNEKEDDDDKNDDDGSAPAQEFDCWPWLVIVPNLSVPGANINCAASYTKELPASERFNFAYLDQATDVTLKDSAGINQVGPFRPPLKLCYRYNQAEMDGLNSKGQAFQIQTYHQEQWEALPTVLESDPSFQVLGRACVLVDHLTLFALFAKDGESVSQSDQSAIAGVKYLPETGRWMVNVWGDGFALSVVMVIGIGFGVWLAWHRRNHNKP